MPHENGPFYRLSEDVRHRTLGSEGIVLRQEQGEVMVVNEVASHVLEFIAQGLDVPLIVDRLHVEYAADREAINSDVDSLLVELEQLGVIEKNNVDE